MSATSLGRSVLLNGVSTFANGEVGAWAFNAGFAVFENSNVEVWLNNQFRGDLTGGNAANTLLVSVLYCVINVTTGLFE